MLFSRISEVDKTNQVIRDEDPTSVEFGNFLRTIIESATDTTNKLIIVMDNLDRLPDEQFSDAWAITRGLIGREGETSSANPNSNVWLVVPYDRTHLSNMFDDGRKGDAVSRAEGFIDKTFDVVLRVSPPLLTHWQTYFYEKLDEALSNAVDGAEKHKLLRLMEYEFLENKEIVTPRAIKSYINSIVSYVLQWRSEIPIECVALYALRRNRLETDDAPLKDGSLLSERHHVLFGQVEWQKYLTSLHYNVSPEHAYQVLIGNDIEAALDDDDGGSKLLSLRKTPGFDLVLGTLVHDKAKDWAVENARGFGHKCNSLSMLDERTPALAQVWSTLGIATRSLGEFANLDDNVRRGLTTLVAQLNQTESWRAVHVIKNKLCFGKITDTSFEGGQRWLQLLDGLSSALGKDRKLTKISVPDAAAFSCGVVAQMTHADSLTLADLILKAQSQELAKMFEGFILSQELEVELEPLLLGLLPILDDADVLGVATQMRARLQTNDPELRNADGLELLRGLLIISRNTTFESVGLGRLEELSDDGSLVLLFERGRSAGTSDLAGAASWCLALVLGVDDPPNPGSQPNYGDTNAAHSSYLEFKNDAGAAPDVTSRVAGLVAEFHYFNNLFDLALKSGNGRTVFGSALASLIDSGEFTRLDIKRVLDRFDELTNLLGLDTATDLIKKLSGWSRHVKPEIVEKCSRGLLSAIHSTLPNELDVVFDLVKTRLDSLNQSEWFDALENESKPLELLFGMLDTMGMSVPAANFRGALQSHAEAVLKGEFAPKKYADEWHLLPAALATQTRGLFYKNLLLWLRDNPVSDVQFVRLVTLYPRFLNDAPLDEHPDVVVGKVLVPLIGNPNGTNLGLIQAHLSVFRKALHSASTKVHELAHETAEGAFSSLPEKGKDEFGKLAGKLSIKLGKPENEDTGDDSSELED